MPEHCIKTFINFGCNSNQRAKIPEVVWHMREQVEFDFVQNPRWVDYSEQIQDIINANL